MPGRVWLMVRLVLQLLCRNGEEYDIIRIKTCLWALKENISAAKQ